MEASDAVVGNVRAILAMRRITYREFADRLGISEMALNRRLNGHVPLSLGEFVRIAEVLDLRPSQLLLADPTGEKASA